jgi:ribosomal peptide maturation radical SAM protein 1
VDVLLVSMPFGLLLKPSIGLSLLKASLAPRGIRAEIAYLTLKLAERVGEDAYSRIANGEPANWVLPGEWIFAGELFDEPVPEPGYLTGVLGDSFAGYGDTEPASPELIASVAGMRAGAGPFLDRCLADVARRRPRIVGFTSTFQQHVASLALARRIKAALPGTFIVMGGANCESVMGAETLRQFPFVDAVVSGEGDRIFPELAERVLSGRPLAGMAGVYVREELAARFEERRFESAPRVEDLDDLPFLDYGDYFTQLAASGAAPCERADVLFETSRGCWWGEKSHCTFCGLNGLGMAYRSKSAQRALAELSDLVERYPGCTVDVVDNILDMGYFKDFLPALARQPGNLRDLHLFYETKANLGRGQLELMRRAGIRSIQPGVESLNDAVLALMGKGVSALQNVQLLKWCEELGIQPYWNLIWGFPGETAEAYAQMAELIPLITHLPPPFKNGPIRIDRFSPHFDRADQFGFKDVKPFPAYFHIYPLPEETIRNLAYYFTHRRESEGYTRPVAERIAGWKRVHEESALFSQQRGDELHVWDLRPDRGSHLVLRGLQAILYSRCDKAQSSRQLQEAARSAAGRPVARDDVEGELQPLVAAGLMLEDGHLYLSLAIPLGAWAPGPAVLGRFFELCVAPRLAAHEAAGEAVQ